MRKNPLILTLSFLILTSCGNGGSLTIKTPNEDGGLEGNAAGDVVEDYDTSKAEKILSEIANNDYYTYEVTFNIPNSETHFTQYYSPKMFFELNDDFSNSIGYAEEYMTGSLFKFYLNDKLDTVTPSVYEYMSGTDSYVKMSDLYSAFTISSFSLIKDLESPDYSVVPLSATKFQITDSNITSILQYMTSYGSSISGYIVSTYFEILDEASGKIKTTLDLGSNGTITGEYTKYTAETFPLKNIENQIKNGSVKGVDCYDDVKASFDKFKANNYTLSGIKVESATGGVTSPTYSIICNENYFYFDYLNEKYTDFGFVFVEKNKTVTCKYDSNGNEKATSYTLPYSACYEFENGKDGNMVFTKLVGPMEGSWKYREVDALPETGSSDTLYIYKGVAYQYTEVTSGEYGFKKYTDWFQGVGDFAINGISASFYIGDVADGMGMFFEKNHSEENTYYTKSEDVMGYFANGLFGWGFQSSTTWMEYIQDCYLVANKNTDGTIQTVDIGLGVMASLDGGSYGKQKIYYTASDFGTSSVPSVEAFLASQLGE